ncbi:MAG: 50S ribosomal protein L13 [Methanosaeta sp. PtaB.Bin018]|jgi:large subunit ribosomal protein L13|nr:MAG: 50S ribosomal protein L13 [Methanosaeta sp. PtaB.Bin018]OPY44865.1 MAG: 50S ribosomal protein L13 [Methanosaeta sp. PtaU1.Bin016]HOV51570.1 50S ribosomal protein L13 [Methanothrix sp.]
MIVVDATGLVMGRLASVTAKSLLAGEEVKIVNAEKAIVTGRREFVFSDYGRMRERGHKERGPYFPRRPDMILKRTVRGMLPYKMRRGRDAFSRLRIYVGIPRELKGMQFEQPEGAKMRTASNNKYIELGTLSRRLGANF